MGFQRFWPIERVAWCALRRHGRIHNSALTLILTGAAGAKLLSMDSMLRVTSTQSGMAGSVRLSYAT